MSDDDYNLGVRDGRIKAIEEMLVLHKEQFKEVHNQVDQLTRRTVLVERVVFGILGAMVIINSLDAIKSLT